LSRNKKLINIREPKRLFFSAIPVVRGGVQQETTIDKEYAVKFQFPWCVGEFNEDTVEYGNTTIISIPVVRGEVQHVSEIFKTMRRFEFQFPWCVGEFNVALQSIWYDNFYFNSRGAWGSST